MECRTQVWFVFFLWKIPRLTCSENELFPSSGKNLKNWLEKEKLVENKALNSPTADTKQPSVAILSACVHIW